jgi:LmbE family N-acetylglucosaminyl deacetylase
MSGRDVFLSPHPDDAVWSYGGRMAALAGAGRAVLLVTCFDGDGYGYGGGDGGAEGEAWRRALRPSLRRGEDAVAARALGISRVSLGLAEAGLRRGAQGFLYPSPAAVLGAPAPADEGLVEILSRRILRVLRPGDRLHAPLGQASHVDHALVRRAAEALRPAHAADYYEEFPYAPPPPSPGLRPSVVAVDFEPWARAALRYRSQVRALFGAPAPFREALGSWARQRGRLIGHDWGERLWSGSAQSSGASSDADPSGRSPLNSFADCTS